VVHNGRDACIRVPVVLFVTLWQWPVS